jgi:hypothetical protein
MTAAFAPDDLAIRKTSEAMDHWLHNATRVQSSRAARDAA